MARLAMFIQAPPVILVLVDGVMKKFKSKHATAVSREKGVSWTVSY